MGNTGIRRKNVSVEDNSPNYSYNRLGIFNVAEIVQNNYQSTQGAQTVSVAIEGDKNVGLNNFFLLPSPQSIQTDRAAPMFM